MSGTFYGTNYGVPITRVEMVIGTGVDGLSGDSGDLAGFVPVGLWTPGAWTAAAITFLGSSDDGATFADLFDSLLGEVTIPSSLIPTGAARRFAIDPRAFLGIKRLKLRSGVSGTAVQQASARTCYLIVRPLS